MSGRAKYYLTTAISYINGPPHLGHAYEAIASDVLARFKRLDGFDVMFRDGGNNGRLMTINLHPWLVGQPFRIDYLEEALAHIMGHDGVWAASGSEIIDWFRSNPPV